LPHASRTARDVYSPTPDISGRTSGPEHADRELSWGDQAPH
jgi:hypothetical protein